MKRILVVKLADIGDVLVTTPALRALRRSCPAAHIAALVTDNGRAVLERTDLVDEIITFDQHRYDSPTSALRPDSLASAFRLALRLRRGGYDACLLLHHLTTTWGAFKYSGLVLASGAALRAGMQPIDAQGRACSRRGWFLNRRVPDGGFGARHEVDHWLALIEALGAKVESPRLEFPLRPEEVAWAGALPIFADPSAAPVVALYPGSGGYSLVRRWPAEQYVIAGRRLQAECGARIAVIGGPQEAELAARVAGAVPGAVNLAGRTTLGQLGAVLRRCRLLVGNDGGPIHIAAGVGTPVVAVFGPSNHLAWGPYLPPDMVRIVRAGLDCGPCFYVGHRLGRRNGCATMNCMELVTPDMVVQAAMDLLRISPISPPGPLSVLPRKGGEGVAEGRQDEGRR